MYKILLYYKYCSLKNPEKLAKEHLDFCKQNSILGRILIGKEGINGTCAGRDGDIEKYKEFVRAIKGLGDVWFKEHGADFIPFKKLKIRCRKEIVALGAKVDITKKARYITPEQLNELYEKNKNDFVIFDVRNEIESRVGHFKNTIAPKIKHFRELPKVIEQYSNFKDKQVVLYCTGGIRCEKASALFKEQGFNNVQQLEGGIYNYCNKYPNGNFLGACFVFDERMNISFEEKRVKYGKEIHEEKIITSCDFCGIKCSRIANDERIGRHLIICCGECDKKLGVSVVKNNKYKT